MLVDRPDGRAYEMGDLFRLVPHHRIVEGLGLSFGKIVAELVASLIVRQSQRYVVEQVMRDHRHESECQAVAFGQFPPINRIGDTTYPHARSMDWNRQAIDQTGASSIVDNPSLVGG